MSLFPFFFFPSVVQFNIYFFKFKRVFLFCSNQELKIEGEQSDIPEEDNLDLMLPAKKKKAKKVDFDEGEPLEKDDGNLFISSKQFT